MLEEGLPSYHAYGMIFKCSKVMLIDFALLSPYVAHSM